MLKFPDRKGQAPITITTDRQPLSLAAPCCSAVLLTPGSHLSQNSTKGEFSPRELSWHWMCLISLVCCPKMLRGSPGSWFCQEEGISCSPDKPAESPSVPIRLNLAFPPSLTLSPLSLLYFSSWMIYCFQLAAQTLHLPGSAGASCLTQPLCSISHLSDDVFPQAGMWYSMGEGLPRKEERWFPNGLMQFVREQR